jgi:transcriptional regulator
VDIEDVESIKKLIQVTQGETEKIVAVVKSLKEMADKAEIKTIPYQGADGEMIDIDEILKKFI